MKQFLTNMNLVVLSNLQEQVNYFSKVYLTVNSLKEILLVSNNISGILHNQETALNGHWSRNIRCQSTCQWVIPNSFS